MATSLFWSSDSSAVAFADSVQDKLSLILARPDGPSTRVYSIDKSTICQVAAGDDPSYDPVLMMTGADFGGSQVLTAHFSATGPCVPRSLSVHVSDFRAPKSELHITPKRGPSVVEGKTK
jgi:hypothetical protein